MQLVESGQLRDQGTPHRRRVFHESSNSGEISEGVVKFKAPATSSRAEICRGKCEEMRQSLQLRLQSQTATERDQVRESCAGDPLNGLFPGQTQFVDLTVQEGLHRSETVPIVNESV